MKAKWAAAVSLIGVAAILAGGYAAVGLSDRLLTPSEEITRVEKGESAAVLQLTADSDVKLYPLDSWDETRSVALVYTALFDDYREEWLSEGENDADIYQEAAGWLYDRLVGGVLPSATQVTGDASELLTTVRYQESAADGTALNMAYLFDFPLRVQVDGREETRRLTAAFRLRFCHEFTLCFWALEPENGAASTYDDVTDLQQTARELNAQFEALCQEMDGDQSAQEQKEFGVIVEGVDQEERDTNPFVPVLACLNYILYLDAGGLSGLTTRESMVYGDEVWFVMQSYEWRLILLYSPAEGAFYGGSITRL